MVRRVPLVVVLVLGLALGATCTRDNAAYCCTDPALCADVGGVVDDCRAGSICDDRGTLHGVPHTCVDDPAAVTCERADDCTAPTPACVGRICVPCATDDDCPAATAARCDLATNRCTGCDDRRQCARFGSDTCSAGVCVACTAGAEPTESVECDAAAPICAAPGICRACTDHRECVSGACDVAAGTCVDVADIAYVDDDASGGNTACTPAEPCKKIGDGVATGRAYVVIDADRYAEVVAIGRSVTLIGHGATLRSSTNPGNALDVSGSASQVGLFGLTLTSSDIGLDCFGGASTRITLIDVVVRDNTGVGVSALRCDLVMQRARITGNLGGGVDVVQGGFDITSSVLAGNGSSGAFGGLRLDGPRLTTARLAFNTIVDNQLGTGTTPSGVACSSNAPLPAFHSNIITGNADGDGQVSGAPNCSHEFSLITPAVPGLDNLTGDPGFVDSAHHIGPSSPAVDKGKANSGVLDDIDGQPRPANRPDIGADEYVAP